MDKPKVAYTPSVLKKIEKKPLLNGEAQPQNYKTGRVFVFGKNNAQCLDEDNDGDDDVVFEMGKVRARMGNNRQEEKPNSDAQKTNIICRPVFPNDTLSKFALQYGCAVAELKAANNLYNEQDFYALKQIKIPIQPHSLLTERAEEEKRRSNAFDNHETPSRSREPSRGNDSDSDYENIDDECTSPTIRTVSISANLKETDKFLKRMDDDIQKICHSVSMQRTDPEDVTRILTAQCIQPRQTNKKDSDELGMIWSGCGWKSVVVAFIFIAIILPMLYFIYIEKFKSK